MASARIVEDYAKPIGVVEVDLSTNWDAYVFSL